MFQKFLKVVLAGLLWLMSAGVFGWPVLLEDALSEVPLTGSLAVLEDAERQLTLEQVRGAFSSRFRSVQKQNTSFGFTQSAIWLRFSIDFSATRNNSWFLVQSHPIIDNMTLYAVYPDGRIEQTGMGDVLPFRERLYQIRPFVFPLVAPGGEQSQVVTYYLQVHGKGALYINVSLLSAQGVAEKVDRSQLAFGIFFGAILVIIISNLLLFLSLRDKDHVLFSGFLIFYLLSMANISGHGLQYLWPSWPAGNTLYTVLMALSMGFLVAYSRGFLELQQRYPLAERILQRFERVIWISVAALIVVPPPLSYHWVSLLVLLCIALLFWLGWRVWYMGHTAARLYVFAWSGFLFGVLFFALGTMAFISHSDLGQYAPHIGGLWVGVMLSLAQGDRINLLECERDRLAAQSEEAIFRHVQDVERLSNDKMQFLSYLSHELNTPLNWLDSSDMDSPDLLPPEVLEYLSRVDAGKQRLRKILDSSFRYFEVAGRNLPPVTGPCLPMWLTSRVLLRLDQQFVRRQQRVINDIGPEVQVWSNEAELTEALSILLENASRFTPQGGIIRVWSREDGPNISILVQDQGPGIAEEQAAEIFQPFFIVGSRHHTEGVGLSLATARLMMQQTGGDITLEPSIEGGGACFRIQLKPYSLLMESQL